MILSITSCRLWGDIVSTSSFHAVGKRHHRLIVDRFRAVLEGQDDPPLAIPAISQMIGISSRTLRIVCQEQLGNQSRPVYHAAPYALSTPSACNKLIRMLRM